MAFGVFSPGFGTSSPPLPPAFDRARAQQPLPEVPQAPPRGSLVIVDTFQDSSEGADHGNVAAYAARQHGFRGPVFAERIGPDGAAPSASAAAWSTLGQGPLKPEQARKAIDDLTRLNQRELLENVTGDLDKLRQKGLADSAVNVSYGTNPQRQADRLYTIARTAPSGGGFMATNNPQSQMARNIFSAYGIDEAKFHNQDKAISGPERLRLQQALLDSAQRGVQSPDVVAAKQRYGESVRALEANNNSVVVSAGNDGEILDNFARDAGGRRVKSASDSNHNVLVNSDVTTVGSTRWFQNGTERLARYSTKDPEVDIYASGSVGNGVDQNRMNVSGTSFAAPRVAGAMAALHGNHPGMPSHAVENLLRQQLTHQVEGQPTLTFQRVEEYLRRGTF